MRLHRFGIGLFALEALLLVLVFFGSGPGLGGVLLPLAYLAVPGLLLFADDRRAPSRALTATALVFLLLPLLLLLLLLAIGFSGGRPFGC